MFSGMKSSSLSSPMQAFCVMRENENHYFVRIENPEHQTMTDTGVGLTEADVEKARNRFEVRKQK